MSRTRVLIVRPSLAQGGADRVTRTLLTHLPRDRFAPSLALVHDDGPWRDGLPDDVPVHVLGGRAFACAPALARLMRRTRPDVVFSTSGGTNVPAILAAESLGHPCRVVVSERNVLFHGGMNPKRALINGAKRVLYPLADSVTAVCASVAREVTAELRVPRVDVVFNPIITADVHEGARAPVEHPFFSASDPSRAPAPVVLAVGRMVKEKGFDVLLRAFADVRRRARADGRNESLPRLVILGDGPLRGALTTLADSLGLAPGVGPTGAVDMPGFDKNPFKYMARATAFVLSSRHEGLPGVLIQAMACGAPAISTDCPGGPAEVIERPGIEGLLVPVDDVAALADAITRVLDDAKLRATLAREGQRAASRFDLATSLALYMEAISPVRAAA